MREIISELKCKKGVTNVMGVTEEAELKKISDIRINRMATPSSLTDVIRVSKFPSPELIHKLHVKFHPVYPQEQSDNSAVTLVTPITRQEGFLCESWEERAAIREHDAGLLLQLT